MVERDGISVSANLYHATAPSMVCLRVANQDGASAVFLHGDEAREIGKRLIRLSRPPFLCRIGFHKFKRLPDYPNRFCNRCERWEAK
jgi:hypothetical protein